LEGKWEGSLRESPAIDFLVFEFIYEEKKEKKKKKSLK